MADDENNKRQRDLPAKGDAIPLPARIDAIEQEQKEAEKRDEHYKKRDLAHKRRQLQIEEELVALERDNVKISRDFASIAEKNASNTDRMIMLTLALVLVGGGGLFFSVWQSVVATRSAIAALRAAKAAEDSVSMARSNFIREQRPYIFVNPERRPGAPPGTDGNREARVGLELLWGVGYANHGNSPAVDVHVYSDILIPPWTAAKVDSVFHGYDTKQPTGSGGIVYRTQSNDPTQYTTARLWRPLTPEDMKAMDSASYGPVVVGRIVYKDMFGNQYRTDFCSEALPAGGLAGCPEHNVPQ